MLTVIQDTREQRGWDLSFYGYETVRGTLHEGDYTLQQIVDLEEKTGRKILRIERKAKTSEIANNLGKNWDVFVNELEKLSLYEHKYIICEFSIPLLMKFPEGSGIPRYLWFRKNRYGKLVKNIKMNGGLMLTRLKEIEEQYGIKVIFAGSKHNAMEEAVKIFKEVVDANKKEI